MESKPTIILAAIISLLLFWGWLSIKPESATDNGALSDNTYSVYFFKGESMFPAKRIRNQQGGNLKLAIDSLFKGPTDQERAQGVFTQIPANLYVNVRLSPSLATIIVDDNFTDISGGTTGTKAILAQIVYTATQFSIVNYVSFETKSGETTLVIGGEGLILDKPMSRDDFREEFE